MQTFLIINEQVKSNCLTVVASLDFDKWEVTIKRKGKTVPQRNYWHMCIDVIAKFTGYEKWQAKHMIKDAVLGTISWTGKNGKVYTAVAPSEDLDVDEYGRLIDYTKVAADKISCQLPDPKFYGLEPR